MNYSPTRPHQPLLLRALETAPLPPYICGRSRGGSRSRCPAIRENPGGGGLGTEGSLGTAPPTGA